MSNKLILIILIIAVLIIGTVAFTMAMSALDQDGLLNNNKKDSKNSIKWEDTQEEEYSNKVVHNQVSQRSACNSEDNLLCFKYSKVEQIRSESRHPKVQQTGLEPCPKPKPVCPICREKIKQVREDGRVNKVIQTRIEC